MNAAAGGTSRRSKRHARNVLVLAGGPSSEREVSLLSGRAVAEALASRGHAVQQADIGPQELSALEGEPPDVVFIALHGAFGEDGRVQTILEARGLAYVGSGPEASRLAMDKSASKRLYRSAGVLTPSWRVLERWYDPFRNDTLIAELAPPCVVKPVDNGSSVDVRICRDRDAQREACEQLLAKHGRCMIEQFAAGRELTVGVVGDDVLPVVEIKPAEGFYDYQAKYVAEDTQYLVNPDLDERTVASLQAAALRAHRALGCRDLSRTDFILDEAGQAWALETNTIPGFTSHSLLPKAAAAAGMSFADLCERLIELAIDRGR